LYIYAFGSVCRGEIDYKSDIDLLAIVEKYDSRFDPNTYSIYSYKRIFELWQEGNPFAWHLFLESKLIYSSDSKNFIQDLGQPSNYLKCKYDCEKFYKLYCAAIKSISGGSCSLVYELSTVFLSIRNFATCFMLGVTNDKNFSRRSALQMGERSLDIKSTSFDLLERARVLSVRGLGEMISKDDISEAFEDMTNIRHWMCKLLIEVDQNG
jgi:Nucleotidyltransferase domain